MLLAELPVGLARKTLWRLLRRVMLKLELPRLCINLGIGIADRRGLFCRDLIVPLSIIPLLAHIILRNINTFFGPLPDVSKFDFPRRLLVLRVAKQVVEHGQGEELQLDANFGCMLCIQRALHLVVDRHFVELCGPNFRIVRFIDCLLADEIQVVSLRIVFRVGAPFVRGLKLVGIPVQIYQVVFFAP